ncbi:MAG: hypothetical protein CL470_05730 [Acidimicrobiaceae bacterium]|nr:hypothetical protein [Acidimicrobiaceae bacterium]|tara:strand:+ start:101 stop:976 length:876 start_codon:yes stop_codon:yes gene_type:complete
MGALPDLSIRQLEYLVAVADAPTWAVAAENVGVSPSALSQGLSELERRVGVPLFGKEGRRRILHPSANIVLDHARQVVSLTGDLSKWAQRTKAADEGSIRVGMIDIAATNHFPSEMQYFRSQHPDLSFHLRVEPSRPLLEMLSTGELDLTVCVEPIQEFPGITTVRLFEEKLAIYRPEGGKLGNPRNWGPWVLFPEDSHTRRIISDALIERGAPVDVVADSPQPEVLREMVNLGLGWTVLPTHQAESGDRPLIPSKILAKRTLVLAFRSNAATDPAVLALSSALQDKARTL